MSLDDSPRHEFISQGSKRGFQKTDVCSQSSLTEQTQAEHQSELGPFFVFQSFKNTREIK